MMGIIEKLHRGISTNSPHKFLKKSLVYACLYSRFANTATATLYWAPTSRYYRWKHRSDLRTYDVSVDPFAYRWVDPENITRFTGRQGDYQHKENIGRILDGSWDQRLPDQTEEDPLRRREENFENHIVYRSFEAHFQNGIPWEQTQLVEYVLEQVENGNRCWGSNTREEVFQRCERLDLLYETIDDHGYQTKRELLGIHPSRFFCQLDPSVKRYGEADHPTRSGHNPVRGFRSIVTNEVMVDIGRDGEVLFVDGRHRLAIAKLLGIEEIPVVILVRHKDWIKRLKRVINDSHEVPSGFKHHPDATALK